MNLYQYIGGALETESNDMPAIANRLADPHTIRLLHASMGLVTRSAEAIDQLKKYIFYGRAEDRTNTVEELGDLMWYFAIACDEIARKDASVQEVVLPTAYDVSMEILEKNRAKLKARYKGKFTGDSCGGAGFTCGAADFGTGPRGVGINRMETNSRVAKQREKTHLEIQEEYERASCPACIAYRCHTEAEWKNHPNQTHGCTEGVWSKPELAKDAIERAEKEKKQVNRRA